MKNNKGFALSATIYSLFIIMLMVIFYILYILTSNRTSVGAITKSIEAEANAESMFNPPQKEWDYGFTGDYQIFEPKLAGKYKFELWGANSRGNYNSTSHVATPGYTKGVLDFSQSDIDTKIKLYVYVGGESVGTEGGWNGGGNGLFYDNEYNATGILYGGGGATDIRSVAGPWQSNLDKRIIIAGGAGGMTLNNAYYSGSATIITNTCLIKPLGSSKANGDWAKTNGGCSGLYNNSSYKITSYISGSNYGCVGDDVQETSFGKDATYRRSTYYNPGHGPQVYYGGAGGGGKNGGSSLITFISNYVDNVPGGGGSSFVSTKTFCPDGVVAKYSNGNSSYEYDLSAAAVIKKDTEYYDFYEVSMLSYGDQIPNAYTKDGTPTVSYHSGNGRVKIHYCEGGTCP